MIVLKFVTAFVICLTIILKIEIGGCSYLILWKSLLNCDNPVMDFKYNLLSFFDQFPSIVTILLFYLSIVLTFILYIGRPKSDSFTSFIVSVTLLYLMYNSSLNDLFTGVNTLLLMIVLYFDHKSKVHFLYKMVCILTVCIWSLIDIYFVVGLVLVIYRTIIRKSRIENIILILFIISAFFITKYSLIQNSIFAIFQFAQITDLLTSENYQNIITYLFFIVVYNALLFHDIEKMPENWSYKDLPVNVFLAPIVLLNPYQLWIPAVLILDRWDDLQNSIQHRSVQLMMAYKKTILATCIFIMVFLIFTIPKTRWNYDFGKFSKILESFESVYVLSDPNIGTKVNEISDNKIISSDSWYTYSRF